MLMASTETLSAKEVARELGTDQRTLRKFLRAVTPKEDQPGQGNRWLIEPKDVKKLRKQFEEWGKAKRPSKNGTEAEIDSEDTEESEELTEVLDVPVVKKGKKSKKEPVVHDLDDEPTVEDLAELELGDVDDLDDIDLDDVELD